MFSMQDGYTPLHLACINRRLEIIDILLSAGAMPDIMENVIKIIKTNLIIILFLDLYIGWIHQSHVGG